MQRWLEEAQKLPLGHKTRVDCPNCGEGTNTNAAITSHDIKGWSIHCFACDYNNFHNKGAMTLEQLKHIRELNNAAKQYKQKDIKLPHDFTLEIPQEGRLWLFEAGITESVWKRYGIGYSPSMCRVVLPVYDHAGKLIWVQHRAILEGQRPKYIQPSLERGSRMFFTNRTEDVSTVVIVEDILSAIRVGRHYAACSLLGTKITTGQAATLGKFPKVIVWLDGDAAGRRGAYNVRRTLSTITDVRDIRTERDPKCYSDVQIKEIINESK